MALTEEGLQEDLRNAMKARDAVRTGVLRGVIAAIKNLKVEKRVEAISAGIGEAELTGLIRKEVSKRTEAVSFAEKAGRADLVEQNKAELAVLEAYMPAQMDAAALEAAVRAIATEIGSTQIGPLMAELRKRHGGQYDGKLASEIIKKL
jgi:hypothetical protein